MSIRRLLEEQFPRNTTEIRVSNEGLFEKLKAAFTKDKANGGDSIQKDEKLYMWGLDLAYKADPKSFELRSGEFEVGPQLAAFFTRNNKPLASVVAEFEKDLTTYRQVMSQNRGVLSQQVRYMQGVIKQFNQLDDLDPDDEDDEKQFIELVRKLIAAAPKTVISSFREPNHAFLGFQGIPFVTRGDDGQSIFDPEKVRKTGSARTTPVMISYPSQAEFIKLTRLLNTLLAYTMDLEMDYDVMGWDGTDPPFRGFSEAVHEELKGPFPFLYPDFDEQNTDFVSLVRARCEALTRTLMWYLHASVK